MFAKIKTPGWLWVSILISTLIAVTLPVISQRQDDVWRRVRGERQHLPLSASERLYQFNVDQPAWIQVIQGFPHYYGGNNHRINRPGYPALLSAACKIPQGIYLALTEFNFRSLGKPCSEPLIFITAWLLQWVFFAVAVIGFYHLLIFWQVGERVEVIAASQFALSPFLSWTLLLVATDFIVYPIIIAVMGSLTGVLQAPRLLANRWQVYAAEFAFGLLLGILMLVKSQYDVVVVAWFVLLGMRRWRALIFSFIGHIIPLLGWMGIIHAAGWEYFNPEISIYRQVIWLWDEFLHLPFQAQLSILQTHLVEYGHFFIHAYGVVTLIAVAVGVWLCIQRRWTHWLVLSLLVVAINCAFIFAIRRYYAIYTATTFFVVYPLAALGVTGLMNYIPSSLHKWATAFYLVIATIVAWAFFWTDAFAIVL